MIRSMSSIRPDEHPSFLDAYTIDSEEDGWEGFQGEDLSELLAEVDRDLDSLAEKGDLDGGGRRRARTVPDIPPADRVDIFDPAHNMREVNKQLLLLEDHLFHPPKYCPDCIRKHLMKSEAFADEAYSLDKRGEFGKTLSWLPAKLRMLQNDFLVGLDKNALAQRARSVRKQLSKETFGALKRRALMERYGEEPEGKQPIDPQSTNYRDVASLMEEEERARVASGECPTPLPSAFFTNNLPAFWKFRLSPEGERDVYQEAQAGVGIAPGVKVWMAVDLDEGGTQIVQGIVGNADEVVNGITPRCIPLDGADEAWRDRASETDFVFRGVTRTLQQWVPIKFRGERGEHGNSWAQWRNSNLLIPVSPFGIVDKYFAGRPIPMFLADGSRLDVVLNSKQLNGLKAIEGALYSRLWLAGPFKPEETETRRGRGSNAFDRPGGITSALENINVDEAMFPPSERLWLDGTRGLKNINVDGIISRLREENPGIRFVPFTQERRLQLWYRVVMSFLVQALYTDSSGSMVTLKGGCGPGGPSAVLQSAGFWANSRAYEFLQAVGLHPDQDFAHPWADSPLRTPPNPQLMNLFVRSVGEKAIESDPAGGSRFSPAWTAAPSASEWATTWAYSIGDPISKDFTGEELIPGVPELEQFTCSEGDLDLSNLLQQTTRAVCQIGRCTPEGRLSPPVPTSTRDSSLPTLVGYAFDPSEQAAFETRMNSNTQVANTIREAKAKEQQAMSSQRSSDEAAFRLWTAKAAEEWEKASTESGELWPLVRAIGMYDTIGDIPTSYRARGELVRRFPGTHWANIAAAERAAMESSHSRFFLRSASEKGQTRKVWAAGLGMGALLFGGLYLKGVKLPGGEKDD